MVHSQRRLDGINNIPPLLAPISWLARQYPEPPGSSLEISLASWLSGETVVWSLRMRGKAWKGSSPERLIAGSSCTVASSWLLCHLRLLVGIDPDCRRYPLWRVFLTQHRHRVTLTRTVWLICLCRFKCVSHHILCLGIMHAVMLLMVCEI